VTSIDRCDQSEVPADSEKQGQNFRSTQADEKISEQCAAEPKQDGFRTALDDSRHSSDPASGEFMMRMVARIVRIRLSRAALAIRGGAIQPSMNGVGRDKTRASHSTYKPSSV